MSLFKKITLAVGTAAVLALAPVAANADICSSTTECTLLFSKLNSGATGDYGYVNMTLSSGTATINIVMTSGYEIITTGFPAGGGTNYSVAFNDTVNGTLTIANFDPNTYGGFSSLETQTLQFDGFGSFNNAVATAPNQGGSGTSSSTLSFTVFNPNLVDIEQLVAPSASPAGAGNALWVVDVVGPGGVTNLAGAFGIAVCANGAPNYPICTPQQVETPEPMSMAILGMGLLGLGAVRLRRRAA